jgi:hypothetical protein
MKSEIVLAIALPFERAFSNGHLDAQSSPRSQRSYGLRNGQLVEGSEGKPAVQAHDWRSRQGRPLLIAPRTDPDGRSLAHPVLLADQAAKRTACPHTRPPVQSRLATLSIESSGSFVASAIVSIASGWNEPVPGWELHPLKFSASQGALLRQSAW